MSTASVVKETSSSLDRVLTETLEKHPVTGRHSYFQLKYFVVGKEPTLQSKMWQCLREMKARKQALDSIDLEREDVRDKIELLRINAQRLETSGVCDINSNAILIKESEVKKRQNARRIVAMEKTLGELDRRQQETTEEASFFLSAFQSLNDIEKCKPFDDTEAQTQYWCERFSQEMNMKLMLSRNVDPELAKAILSLPDEAVVKKELVCILTHLQSAMEASRTQNKLTQGENG